MSKFSASRKTIWRRLAKKSLKKATDPKASNVWAGVGIAATILHAVSLAHEPKKRTIWRGKLRPGETLVFRNKHEST